MQFIVENSGAVTISTGDLLITSTVDHEQILICVIINMECESRQDIIISSASKVNALCEFYTLNCTTIIFNVFKIPLGDMSRNACGEWRRVAQQCERSILEFMGTNVY
jgi:hypothetical protein